MCLLTNPTQSSKYLKKRMKIKTILLKDDMVIKLQVWMLPLSSKTMTNHQQFNSMAAMMIVSITYRNSSSFRLRSRLKKLKETKLKTVVPKVDKHSKLITLPNRAMKKWSMIIIQTKLRKMTQWTTSLQSKENLSHFRTKNDLMTHQMKISLLSFLSKTLIIWTIVKTASKMIEDKWLLSSLILKKLRHKFMSFIRKMISVARFRIKQQFYSQQQNTNRLGKSFPRSKFKSIVLKMKTKQLKLSPKTTLDRNTKTYLLGILKIFWNISLNKHELKKKKLSTTNGLIIISSLKIFILRWIKQGPLSRNDKRRLERIN